MIHIKSLSKKFANADDFAVDNLSLDIEKGEIFGLLGPNGAGKTTLISMLCGLVKPTSGTFTINNWSYKKKHRKIKKIIGVVPQEYALYPTLTARENLQYFGAMYGLRGSNLRDKVNSSLEHLGLTPHADKQIGTYSGGMKRRVNLIAGTLHRPTVLFLDEPTVGVDVQSKIVIMDYLKMINADGATIIYTSHHLSEAQDFCTHIAILEQGKIFAQGTPANLINSTPDAHSLEDVYISLTGKAVRDNV